MNIIKPFTKYSSALTNMNFLIQPYIEELVISYRSGAITMCVITDDLDVFRNVVGDPPAEIANAVTRRYAVDLESIGTDQQRMYVDSPESAEAGIGYYFNAQGVATQKKIYKKLEPGRLGIDRYDMDGNLLSAEEPEVACTREDWGGSDAIADDAEAIRADVSNVVYMKKENVDQSYIRIVKDKAHR